MKRYNYFELIKEIENAALQHPAVHSFHLDRFSINEDDICNPALVVTTDRLRVGEHTTNVGLTFLYADRLSETESNALQLQSLGVDVITEIVNALREELDMNVSSELTFTVFRNRYADNVAGAVLSGLSIDMETNISRCSWFEYTERGCYGGVQ